MIKDIQFSYYGSNAILLIKIAQLAFEETMFFPINFNLDALLYEQELAKTFSRSNAERRYELILDLHGCLDADL